MSLCILLALLVPAHAGTLPQLRRASDALPSQVSQSACLTGDRERALFEAITGKDSARVATLLAAGVSPNARAEINYETWENNRQSCATALMHAARAGDVKIVEALLAAGAKTNASDDQGRHVWAYALGYHTIRRLALERLQDELNARLQLTKALLAAGAQVNAPDTGGWSETALFHAVDAGVLTGDLRILKILLAARAAVNMENNTIIGYAVSTAKRALDERVEAGGGRAPGAAAVIQTLLAAGANVRARRNGFTALQLELNGSRLEGLATRLKVLLDAGADPNERSDENGATPLFSLLRPYPDAAAKRPGHDPAAASKEQVDAIKLLLAAGADPNRRTRDGFAPLHAAILTSGAYATMDYPLESDALLKTLLAAGANINARDGKGRTPLLLALTERFETDYFDKRQEARVRLLKTLVAAGADVNLPDNEQQTPILAAVRLPVQTSDELIRTLLAAGANVNAADSLGRTALMEAINRSPDTTSLLLKAKADVNLQDRNGETALMQVLKAGRSDDFIKPLLNAAPNINLKNSNGDTALIIAARAFGSNWMFSAGNLGVSIMGALVAAGADVKHVNQDGESALTIMATKSGPDSLTVIRSLLAAGRRDGARGYPRTVDLLAAIRRAAGRSPAEIVQELIAAGADVNGKDEQGRSALIVAVGESGNAGVVRALVAAGARVNASDANGDTALIVALREYLPGGDEPVRNALRRDTEVIRALLAAGAEKARPGRDGETALSLAKKSGNQKVLALLEEAGARP
ncbi:MAG TPA: ankyrin repeat domain-containing protein [Pyrinomonadaceae bacterium]